MRGGWGVWGGRSVTKQRQLLLSLLASGDRNAATGLRFTPVGVGVKVGEPGAPLGWDWKGASQCKDWRASWRGWTPEQSLIQIQCHTLEAFDISSSVGMGFSIGHIAPGKKQES